MTASPVEGFPPEYQSESHEWEKRDAGVVLAGRAPDADSLRAVLTTLGLYEPPAASEPAPVLCVHGHDQEVHGVVRKDGRRICRECSRIRTQRHRDAHGGPRTMDATGTRRRLQHLRLNGWSLGALAEGIGISETTISHVLIERTWRVRKSVAEKTRIFFDDRRDEVRERSPFDHSPMRGFVWAECYERLDDPDCQPVMGVAA